MKLSPKTLRAETKRKYKMSETETEIETVETNAVEELINQITAGELNKAEGSFKSIIDDKMADALEAQRIAVAGQIFNGDEEVSDEDIVDEYIEDEEDGTTEETEDETLELGGEGEDGAVADFEASTEEEDYEEITAEEEAAVEEVFEEDEEILAELEDEVVDEDEQ